MSELQMGDRVRTPQGPGVVKGVFRGPGLYDVVVDVGGRAVVFRPQEVVLPLPVPKTTPVVECVRGAQIKAPGRPRFVTYRWGHVSPLPLHPVVHVRPAQIQSALRDLELLRVGGSVLPPGHVVPDDDESVVRAGMLLGWRLSHDRSGARRPGW